MSDHVANSISDLAHAIKALGDHSETNAILHRLAEMEKIMSVLSDQLGAVQSTLDGLSTKIDAIGTGIQALDDLITKFQNSPGTLGAADQAALDAIQKASTALVAKVDALNVAPPAPPAA